MPSFSNVKKFPILEKITRQQINDNINYLRAKDKSHLCNDFIEFNRKLDVVRKTGPLEIVVPEFKNYL